ncbi:POK19 protein, partial [Xiphorhynchus elegans]|nr:POK19 protein [Xiphorhynchus elegans]
MGALQPGLPLLTMLPRNWHLTIIDLKDCFFTIPLQEQDTCRFAFTLPSTNKERPAQRFEWIAAQASHAMFHQNAKTLRRVFGLSWSDAQGIVKACDICSRHSGSLG